MSEEKEELPEKFEFQLDLREIPVTFIKDGEQINAKMVELTGQQRDGYFNTTRKRYRGRADNNDVHNFTDVQTDLLCLCMMNLDTGKLFSRDEIRAWPATVQMKLYKSAQTLNGLVTSEDDDDEGED